MSTLAGGESLLNEPPGQLCTFIRQGEIMNDYRRSAKLVGVALIAVGLFNLGLAVYSAVRTQGLSVSGGAVALIPGVALLTGNRRAGQVIAFLTAMLMGVYAVGLVAMVLTIPAALVLPALRSFPAEIAKGALSLIVGLALALLICRTSWLPVAPAADVAKHAVARRARRKLFYAFSAGAAVAAVPAFLALTMLNGDVARRAKEEAARMTGPGYQYVVYRISFGVGGPSDSEPAQHPKGAELLAFNSRGARKLEVTWRE